MKKMFSLNTKNNYSNIIACAWKKAEGKKTKNLLIPNTIKYNCYEIPKTKIFLLYYQITLLKALLTIKKLFDF